MSPWSESTARAEAARTFCSDVCTHAPQANKVLSGQCELYASTVPRAMMQIGHRGHGRHK